MLVETLNPAQAINQLGWKGREKGERRLKERGGERWCPPLFAGVPPVGSGWRCDFLSEWLSNCVMFEDDCIRIRDVNETFSFQTETRPSKIFPETETR